MGRKFLETGIFFNLIISSGGTVTFEFYSSNKAENNGTPLLLDFMNVVVSQSMQNLPVQLISYALRYLWRYRSLTLISLESRTVRKHKSTFYFFHSALYKEMVSFTEHFRHL